MRAALRRGVTGLSLALSIAEPVQAQCLPLICNFTESGKSGTFLATNVTPQGLAKADEAISKGIVDGALSAAGSVNRGEYFGSGLKMPALEAALLDMIKKLRAQWQFRQPGDIKIRIVGSMQFAPQAHPDGVIIVPLGMVVRARTDDQIAWLMGHEFAHLALGHFSREAKVRKVKRATSSVVSMLQGGVAMSQTQMSMQGGQMQSRTSMSPEAKAVSEKIYARSRTLNDVLALANQFFSRAQEDQADVLGMDLAIRAKFNDGGASDSLNEISKMEGASSDLFSKINEEMTEYTKVYAQTSLQNAAGIDDLSKAGQSFASTFLQNLKTVALNKAFDYYNRSHRPTLKRREGVLKYYGNAYKGVAANEESTMWLDAARATQEFKDGSAVVTAVARADQLLVEGKVDDAAKVLVPAFSTPFGKTPYLANAAAEVYWRAKRMAEADRQFSIAERLPGNGAGVAAAVPRGRTKPKGKAAKSQPPVSDMSAGRDPYFEQNQPGFQRHITLLIEMKSYAKALSVIDVATGRFGDDYAFLPAKLQIYIAQRNAEAIIATMAKCSDSQDEALRRQCNDAIVTPGQADQVAALSPVDQAKINKAREKLAGAAESKAFWDKIAQSLKPSDD